MIPTFGLIYTAAAGSFYQTSATHEPSYLADESNVAQAVAQGAYRNAQDEVPASCNKCAPLEPPIGSFATTNATDLLISITYLNASRALGNIVVQLDIPVNQIPSSAGGPGGYAFVPYSVVTGFNQTTDGSDALSLQLFEQYTNSTSEPNMQVTTSELDSIQQFADAAQGIVSGLPDQFSRMLYFSAVSATTLGFGDIVPVTTLSRSFVTLEAILGVVFAGLFLNSLARRRPSEPTEKDSTLSI
jgi:hypothetical protein